ncbi:MAG: hypothetical protein HHAS10_01250 [Candidatus Altimarinota bacterium]
MGKCKEKMTKFCFLYILEYMGKNSTGENFEFRAEGSVLPHFQLGNVSPIFRRIEEKNIPKNLTDILDPWTEILREKMRYDALNYGLFREVPLDEEQGGFIDKIDPKKIGMNPAQKMILKRYLGRMRADTRLTGDYMKEFIDSAFASLEKGSLEFIQSMADSPTLRKFLLSDPDLAREWHGLIQNRTVSEVLAQGIGSCKTLAVISKLIIEQADRRYQLGIKGIKIIENDEFHVTLEITTKDGKVTPYDPTSALYKSTP